ncbi:site-specific integrase [Limosilactobacillus reuteri]|uniref:site-specific integrase n=1 Tax=Limosilactobacillus reuteri TaxID=1598 RepID=UPI002B05ABD9|nr:site-specific integrase [Limosilactobacillus reuteri]
MSEEMINVYQTWINSLASANTIHKYTSSVTLFSNMVFKKKTTEISEFDLVHLRYSDVLNKFVTPLKENDIKGSTIKGHLIAVRSLMKMIKKEGIYDKANIDDLNNYPKFQE